MTSRFRRFSLLMALLVGAGAAPLSAQTPYTIQGTVVADATGEGLAGAQVAIRGTSLGAITDSNGRYMIRANLEPGNYDLAFSYIGRRSAAETVVLGGDATVMVPEVRMEESALELEEIVVTGTAGPTTRRAMGNSVSTVQADQIETSPATSIDQALQGKIAGAVITSNSGMPGGGISVRLRGTSSITGGAEPLYIVDGVIIDNNASQQINVGNRSNPINRLADLSPNDIARVEVLKGAAAAALYGSRANNGVVQIFTKRGQAGDTRVQAAIRATRSDLEHRTQFAMTPVDEAGNTVKRFDHQDLIFRDGWGQDMNVSVSGGAGDTRYYISTSYTDQEGILIGSAHNKLNARLNLDQSFGRWLSLSVGANYIQSNTDLIINGEQGEGGLLTAIMFTPTTVDLGAVNPETGDYVVQSTVFPNPLVVTRDWRLPQTVDRFVGSFQARSNPLMDLTMEYRLGYDTYSMETRQSIPRGSTAAPTGRAVSANRDNMLINNDLVGNYVWHPASSLQMTTSAGMNHTYQVVDQLNASATDITPLTRFVRGAVQAASQSQTELVTLGYFAQQQIDWRNALYLTGALRWDASSTFGPDERWQLYPKVGASYVVSEETYFQDSPLGDLFSEFRIRGALGYAGNQPSLGDAYARSSRYGTAINNARLGLVPLSRAGNPELRPERQREYEFGLDLGALHDRLGLSLTYYDQYTDDLLLSRVFAPSSGVGSILDNVGALSNWGIEAELNTVNMERSGFRWSSALIFSKNENVVEKLEGDPFNVGYTNRVEEGQPLGVHYMIGYERDEQGNIVYDGDNLPVQGDRQFVGNPWPDFAASLRNDFEIGDAITFGLLFDGQFGHELWNQSQRIMDIFDAGAKYDAVLRGDMTAAALSRDISIWESYLEDASFVKLREASLRWKVPASLSDRIGAGGMQLEVMGRNLITWTDYSGYDPEINMFGLSTVERGTDFAAFPNSRELSVGIRLDY